MLTRMAVDSFTPSGDAPTGARMLVSVMVVIFFLSGQNPIRAPPPPQVSEQRELGDSCLNGIPQDV